MQNLIDKAIPTNILISEYSDTGNLLLNYSNARAQQNFEITNSENFNNILKYLKILVRESFTLRDYVL